MLDILFKLPCRKPMAFKGGTSLSKVYQAIDRFSEDIDVTVDYRSLVDDAPELVNITSNTQRSKLSEQLKLRLADHLRQELVPALGRALGDVLPGQQVALEVGDDAEKLRVFYPGVVENAAAYLRPSILIEFGGRNSTLPQQSIEIVPDVAAHVRAIAWPKAQVSVLSPTRTFWEKATLIHVECHHPQIRIGADRLSRHWYDLARLADHDIGRQAIGDVALLKNVLQIKETFYRSSYSNYDRCLTGRFSLIPEAGLVGALRQDYQAMLDAQMFYGMHLPFDDIVARLRLLEAEINRVISKSS